MAANQRTPPFGFSPVRSIPRSSCLATLALVLVLAGCETTTGVRDTSRDGGTQGRAHIQTQLGIGYMREGQLDQAYQRFTSALDIDPGYAPAHEALGLLYERLQKPEQAGEEYARATRLDPQLASAHNKYGGWLCSHDHYSEAIQQFEQAAANPLYESPELALFNAGVCKLRQGDSASARKYFRRSLQKNPKFPQSLFAMSELSLAASNNLSARAYLQRYMEVGAHTARSLWLGVRIERELGDKNAVSSYSMLLKSKFPDSPETKQLLASERP